MDLVLGARNGFRIQDARSSSMGDAESCLFLRFQLRFCSLWEAFYDPTHSAYVRFPKYGPLGFLDHTVVSVFTDPFHH